MPNFMTRLALADATADRSSRIARDKSATGERSALRRSVATAALQRIDGFANVSLSLFRRFNGLFAYGKVSS
jgi:hypothetical protein